MLRRAFTLVEILVVLAITTLLAAVLFPVFSGVRESAQRSSCLSNQRQVVAAMQMYVQDNARLATQEQNQANNFGWDLYGAYAKSKAIFQCPLAAQIGGFPIYWSRRGPKLSALLPQSQTVVAYCHQHLLETNSQGSTYPSLRVDASYEVYIPGPWLVARWDGSAKLIQGSQTRQWVFQKGKWQKQLFGTTADTDAILETRFPDEEWPLQFG